jgi:hypothetical protein
VRDKMAWNVASLFKTKGYGIFRSLGSIIPGEVDRLLPQAEQLSSHSACQNPVSPGPEQLGRACQPASGQRELFFRPARRSPRPAPASVLAMVSGRSPWRGVSESCRTGLAARQRAIAGAMAPALSPAAVATGPEFRSQAEQGQSSLVPA